jgi:hypothetical protein
VNARSRASRLVALAAAYALAACGGGAARDRCGGVVCAAKDACHVAGICDPATGACSDPPAADGTACNADSNGCTKHDSCRAGSCTAGPLVACITPPSGGCYRPLGTCTSTGDDSFTCSYTKKSAGSACVPGADKCLQKWICDADANCLGSEPRSCLALDGCQTSGTCNPVDGTCSNVVQPDGTLCDADGNGCTLNDSCQSGVCTAGPDVICNVAPGQCQGSSGTCLSTGATSYECIYGFLPAGAPCSDGSLCTQTDACDGNGGCIGSSPVNCASSLCSSGGTCNPASGACEGGSNQPNGTACSGPDACSTYACAGGVCAGTFKCAPGQACTQAAPVCRGTAPMPILTETVRFTSGRAVIGRDGAAYVVGSLQPPTKTIGTTPLTSAGMSDVGVLKLDASGNPLWAKNYGDAADQAVNDVAVTDPATNRVAVIGRFVGLLGTLNAGAAVRDFILLLDGSTGAIATSRAIDTGLGGVFLSVGANPNLGLVAVCGKASKLAADTTSGVPGTTWATNPGAAYGGSNDILIGLYKANGTLLWARQFGGPADEECDAVTIDDAGNVAAAGSYSGTAPNLSFTGATLPNPGSSFRRWTWVATFDGAAGAALAQAAFGGGAGINRPYGIAVTAAGDILLAGNFDNTLPLNGTNTACAAGSPGCLASAGGKDGFVAKLSPTLAPVWATRIGNDSADDMVRGVAVDSFGNVFVGGYLNGAATASTVTPTTTETAPIGDGPACVPGTPGTCALTAPGGSGASFVAKLPGATGLFDPGAATATGNALSSITTKVSVNRSGVGALRDALLWDGDYSTSLVFAPLPPIVATDPSQPETFVVFGVLH